ncbi:MAG: endo-1,4-beta-xylanase [Rhizomicrobium sp.]
MSELSRRHLLALSAAAAALAPLPAFAGDAPDSLNGLAGAKGLRFGSCLGTGPSGAPHGANFDPRRSASYDDPRMRELFVRECGILVPENELKWYAIRPTPEVFDFSRADTLMDFAAANGLLVRGHTLLWNSPKWFPKWFETYDFGSRPATEAERLLTEHIKTVCAHCGNRIFAWDVVNETIDHDTGLMRDTPFTKYLGLETIDIAFRAARAAAPKAQLVYNDYMAWGAHNAAHRGGVLKLLERLRRNGVPIDALGVQAHIGPGAPEGDAVFTADDQKSWRGFIADATAMNLDVVITELDVNDRYLPADIAARDAAIAALAKDYLSLMLDEKRLRYVMAWGLVDKYSWLQDNTPRADGLPKRPSPYDNDYQPKPLREAIAAAFRAAPQRSWLL